MTTVHLARWRTDLWLTTDADVPGEWLAAQLEDAVAGLDHRANRFRSDSLLTAVSRDAGRWVPIDEELHGLLRTALDVAAATDGLVHPGLGAQAAGAGYDGWAGEATPVAGAQAVPDWHGIELSPPGAPTAARIPPGMVLDLGAVAKAWLADRLAVQLAAQTGTSVCANLGGDVRVVGPRSWAIALDPELPGGPAPRTVHLRDAGIAVSGLSRRSWSGGHHLIDPRTGAPARTPWWSVAVLAADAVGANACSTAAMVLGDAASAWLASTGVTAWLVGEDTCAEVGRWQVAAA